MSRWCPGTYIHNNHRGRPPGGRGRGRPGQRAAGAEGGRGRGRPVGRPTMAGLAILLLTRPPGRQERTPRSDRRTYLGYLHRYAVSKQNRAVVRGGLVPGVGPESWGDARRRGAVNSFFILLVSTTWLRERGAAPLTVSSIPAAHTYWVRGHIYIYIYLVPT
jgi:hypothetical protein